MSFYKANSWGRTRSPKNLAGPPGTKVVCLSNTNNLRLSNTDYKTEGYATENQRYLHLLIEDNEADPDAITAFGYCHAFERWFQLPQVFDGFAANSFGSNAVSMDLNNSGRTSANKVPSDRQYRTYHISGIDRVAFVCSTPDDINVWAACSSF